MNKLTKLAQEWHAEGLDDSRVIDNVLDEVLYDFLEQWGIELGDHEEPRLEALLRSIISDNIDWAALEEADQEARDYRDARDSALYE